ncbi:hypothetical protein QQ045_019550 [Rhodiola kirilowii]
MKSQAAEMDRRQTRSMLRSKRDTGKDKQLAPIDSATAARTAFTGLPRSAPYASLSAGNLLRVGYDLRQSRRVSQREGQEKRTKADLPRERRRISMIEFLQRDGSLHRKQITVLQTRTHRTPCQCRDICEKHCPCVTNKVCCEKFCGCSDQCEQRYRDAIALLGSADVKGVHVLLLIENVTQKSVAVAGIGTTLNCGTLQFVFRAVFYFLHVPLNYAVAELTHKGLGSVLANATT